MGPFISLVGMKMNHLIKIGEMAKLFGVNIRTLRYYDDIGILKAAYTDEKTGYRYYSIEQFEQLNVIRYFRAQGMSLESIREIMEHRDPQKIQNQLKKQYSLVQEQLRELQLREIRLKNRIQEIQGIMDPERLHRLQICELPERPAVAMNLRIRGDAELEMHLRSLEHKNDLAPSFFLGKVGLSMSLRDLQNWKLEHYQRLFCLIEPGETEKEPTFMLPAGLWAKWRFLGHHADSPSNYRHMLELLKKQGLIPVGDAAEFALMDAGLTDQEEEYTTEIQIPVAYL